jgi:hypothetical protein
MMVKVASLFSQLLQHIPRSQFAALVAKHKAERASKGFACWTQLVAMLFCQMAQADSLREICNGLACCLGKLSHLGLKEGPKRSTLSYANEHRPAALYEDLFWWLSGHFRDHGGMGARKKKFRFKNKLFSFDSTTITLCLKLFPWASYRQTKGGVKLHVLLDHDDYMPSFTLLTNARQHDRKGAAHLQLNRGSIVAMDRGYNDYGLFASWCRQGVFFVTRLKEGARYRPVKLNKFPNDSPILSDCEIELTEEKAWEQCPFRLRRVVVYDAKKDRNIELLTNHLDFASTTIGEIYKDRWEIELFFKALKQNLKVKTFVGTSENALRIQIWTALIALLLLKWLHHLSRASWSLSNLASMLRLNLFTYRDLMCWLHDPFGTPPEIPEGDGPIQLTLDFGQVTS